MEIRLPNRDARKERYTQAGYRSEYFWALGLQAIPQSTFKAHYNISMSVSLVLFENSLICPKFTSKEVALSQKAYSAYS